MKFRILALLIVMLVAVTACDAVQTTGSANDAQSAANIMPSIQGFSTTDTVEIQDALASAGIGSTALSGNPVAAAAVARMDQFADCLRNVGAFSAKIYTNAGQVSFGALAVVNEERLSQNLVACALNPDSAPRAQGALSAQPCTGSGRITYQGVTYSYAFVATDRSLCSTFETHFNNINGK